MKKILLPLFTILFSFYACKKAEFPIESSSVQTNTPPLLRIDNVFPNGILQFKSKESFKFLYNKIDIDKQGIVKEIPANFKNLNTYFSAFKENQIAKKNNNLATSISSRKSILEVDNAEYLFDLKEHIIDGDNALGDILNADLQVVISDQLYQMTDIGLFTVDLQHLQQFENFYAANENDLLYNPNYLAVPGETPLGNNTFEVMPGVIRTDFQQGRMMPFCDIDDPNCDGVGGGITVGGVLTGAGGSTSSASTLEYDTYTVNEDFQSEQSKRFGDRRFVFKTQNISVLGFFHKIDIKAKLQREKKILWGTYWGTSYADEIIVGCDNMSLETNYIFPYPHQFSTITRPTFDGLADFKIGNQVLKTANINVNATALGYSLNNAQVSSFINNGFNSFVGNQYNNIFKLIEKNILNAIDPSYNTSFANYTKMVKSLDAQHMLKWVIGQAEIPQGYSHENTWRFDYNFGTGGGGTTYEYKMKAGSFYGRARVGNSWYGIRVVKL